MSIDQIWTAPRIGSVAAWLLVAGGFLATAEAADPLHPRQEVGQRASDFELPIVGRSDYLRLSDTWRDGPVVVVVLRGYPGYQCMLCSRQVASLANRARKLDEHAARVVLVYPTPRDKGARDEGERRAEQFAGSRRLPEPLVLVRDDEMKVITEWGLRWDRRNETAYPATYVIDRNGRIRWQKVSDSHAGRASVEEILKVLRTL